MIKRVTLYNFMRTCLLEFLFLVCLPVWCIAQVPGPPTVISTSPATSAQNVFINTIITATFSEPMDLDTITTNTFIVRRGSNNINGTVSYTDTTATFKPTVSLLNNITYDVTITTGVTDVDGEQMAVYYTWSFTTNKLAPPASLASLKTLLVPLPDNLDEFVKDRTAAIQLGKTLFWDMQVGSDGIQACASCHFHAGADSRFKNQVSPGFDNAFNGGAGANYTLTFADFPRPKTNNDVTGSQGIFKTLFNDIIFTSPEDDGTLVGDTLFNVNGIQTRQVTGRNSPSVINAIFNSRNFWDGRANEVFNGVDPFGQRNNAAKIKVATGLSKPKFEQSVIMGNASAASQSVGPPNNSTEMAYDGRTFPDIAKKLFHLTPLGKQIVHPDDDALGSLANLNGTGLITTYQNMIMNAFHPKYWRSARLTNGYTLMESNFSLFWGISIMLYESTMVSDDSPFDKFMDGDQNALTQQQLNGKLVFEGKGRCILCHEGAEFTNAAVPQANEGQEERFLDRMVFGDRARSVLYDIGFYNIGVRQTDDDLGVGGVDPFGNPLSFTRQYLDILQGSNVPDQFQVDPCFFQVPFQSWEFTGGFNPIDCDGDGLSDIGVPTDPSEIQNLGEAVNGAFKVPSLRNVELTGPFFHNGGKATLRQVVEFYNIGGDFRIENLVDTPSEIGPLGLTEQEITDLIAFLMSLTDERVRHQKAPFDHPQLFIPPGHPDPVTDDGTGKATDDLLEIPSVGRDGSLTPLEPFLNLSQF